MFKQKNVLISLAVAAVLAACGGGGSDTPANTAQNNQNQNQNQNQNTTTTPTEDAKMKGTLQLVGDELLFPQGDVTIPITYAQFTSKTPRDDGTGYGGYGFKTGDASPLAWIGMRVRYDSPTPDAAETGTGRFVFTLQDQAAPQEVLQIEVDNVTVASTPGQGFTLTADPAKSKVYVYAKNSAGGTANATTAAPANLFTKQAIPGDTTSAGLIFNIDTAMKAAVAAATAAGKGNDAAVLTSAKGFTATKDAPFEVSVVLSNVNMKLESNAATSLTVPSASVTGSNVAGVKNGSGIAKGYLQVE